MKRTALKRSTKPMRKRSKKTEARYAGTDGKGEGRRAFVARILTARTTCEACGEQPATDVHEKLRRSAGGSITDDANVLALCRPCHEWVHHHPEAAMKRGLLESRYSKEDL